MNSVIYRRRQAQVRMLNQDEKKGGLFSELLPAYTGAMHLALSLSNRRHGVHLSHSQSDHNLEALPEPLRPYPTQQDTCSPEIMMDAF